MRAQSANLVLICALAVFAIRAATADTLPHRKPGLWQATTTMPGGMMGQMSSKACVDTSTDNALMNTSQAMARKSCTSTSIHVSGSTAVMDATCKFGPVTSTSHTVITFLGSDAYRSETHTRMSPVRPGMPPETVVMQEAKWAGPCPADMKPGDVVMGNGMRFNQNSMNRSMGPGGH